MNLNAMNTIPFKANKAPAEHKNDHDLTLIGGRVMIDPSKSSEITDTNKAFAPPNESVGKAPHAQLDRPQPSKAMGINTTCAGRSDADQVTSSLASLKGSEDPTVNPIPASSDLPSAEERKQVNGIKSIPTNTITPSIVIPSPSYFGSLSDEENEETIDSERRRRRQEFANKRRRHTKATSLQAHYDNILSQVAALQNNNITERVSTRNDRTRVERHYLSIGADLLAEMDDEEDISDDENDENNQNGLY